MDDFEVLFVHARMSTLLEGIQAQIPILVIVKFKVIMWTNEGHVVEYSGSLDRKVRLNV